MLRLVEMRAKAPACKPSFDSAEIVSEVSGQIVVGMT
jgi:hypothetical protein